MIRLNLTEADYEAIKLNLKLQMMAKAEQIHGAPENQREPLNDEMTELRGLLNSFIEGRES